MRSYTIRSFIILIIFMNITVLSTSLVHSFRTPIVLWWSYFFVLMILSFSYRKHQKEKAFINMIILLLIGLPIAGVGIPVTAIIKTFNTTPLKSTLYIFISTACLLYLVIRHQGYNTLETISKVSNYLIELKQQGIRSSLFSYIIFEVLLFLGAILFWSFYRS